MSLVSDYTPPVPPADRPRVTGLYAKLTRGEPMTRVDRLDLDPADGIAGDAHAIRRSPRQVCIVADESLDRHGVKPAGARANIVLAGAVLASGALLDLGAVRIRVTFACEPCTHGATLADAPMRRFRELDRYLGVPLEPGHVDDGTTAMVTPAAYPAWAGDFRTRVRQALDHIPPGRAVGTIDFLVAIGAGPGYARALPRWMHAARDTGGQVHRVLTTAMAAPSWAPAALDQLAAERLTASPPEPYPLVDALWF